MGGGCHWCTEAVFQSRKEVHAVDQGYIASSKPYDSYSEAVIIYFNSIDDLELLVRVHLKTHASTKAHSRRDTYRSAIYYVDLDMKARIEAAIYSIAQEDSNACSLPTASHTSPYVTRILPFVSFKPSRESIQNYYATRPGAPFCQRYIKPKLKIAAKIK